MAESPEQNARFAKSRKLSISGRTWTVAYWSEPEFEANSWREFALGVMADGDVLNTPRANCARAK